MTPKFSLEWLILALAAIGIGQNIIVKFFSTFNQIVTERIKAVYGVIKTILQQVIAVKSGKKQRMEETTALLKSVKTFVKPSVSGQTLAIGGILLGLDAVSHIKRLADQAEKMTGSLEKIGNNAYSQNSRGDCFPGHVHSFVRSMIRKCENQRNRHLFFVFNPSTTWHAKFDEINSQDPLGDTFLTYSHDLDELVATVVEVVRPVRPDTVVHILIPTIGPLAITESLTFPEEFGPFRITGQLDDSGLPFVYLRMPLEQDRRNFRHIGSLRALRRWVLVQSVGLHLPILDNWLLRSCEPVFFEEPIWKVQSGFGSPIYSSLYFEVEPRAPRILGSARA